MFAITGKNPLLDIALELEEVALSDDYFISRKLYPNVDFYSGLIYQAMGFPIEMFTVLFAIPRTAGWLAHWVELLEQDQKIARPRQLYVGPGGAGLRRHRPAQLTAPCTRSRSSTARSSGASTPTRSRPPGEVAGRRCAAAGLNGADRLQVAGLLPAAARLARRHPRAGARRRGARARPGHRAASPSGDRVMAVVGGGGQAERAVVHERHLLPVPDGDAVARGRRLPRGRHHRLRRPLHPVRARRRRAVCVHGAAGGVGMAAVQLAVAAGRRGGRHGARPERAGEVAALHRRASPSTPRASSDARALRRRARARRRAQPRRPTSGPRPGGRISVIGVGRGRPGRGQPARAMGKRARIHGSTLRARSLEEKADGRPARWSATCSRSLDGGHRPGARATHVADGRGAAAYEQLRGRGQAGQDRPRR